MRCPLSQPGRLLLMTIVLACRRSPPTASVPGSDATQDRAVVPAASVASILERASEFHLIVPSDDGQICQRWNVERAASANNGGRTIQLVQDLQAAASRLPIHLRIEWNDEQITVFDPRAKVPGSGEIGASLGSCTSDGQVTACDGYEKQTLTLTYDGPGTITTKQGARLFLDGRACRAALQAGERREPMICSPVLSRYARGVDASPISKRFADILERGGQLVRRGLPLISSRRPVICETWSIRAGARRSFVYRERAKEGCSEFLRTVDLAFERVGSAILWKGPRFGPNRVIRRCSGTPGVGEGTIGCGDYLPLIGRGGDRMAIGRDEWYLDRRSCQRDLGSHDD